ncbi:hypothetical protein SKAU_G00189000 [Synaphobranchus kaupii]|uniref:Uncharacterized protein n=1 Tax=Synaphobranchus kaupii TaxID=118154 RepID=A0A9Q1FDB8_SYNKA|nr:hypothetical protein SKAU_G00189000 [Synaphobranchus kaupii]
MRSWYFQDRAEEKNQGCKSLHGSAVFIVDICCGLEGHRKYECEWKALFSQAEERSITAAAVRGGERSRAFRTSLTPSSPPDASKRRPPWEQGSSQVSDPDDDDKVLPGLSGGGGRTYGVRTRRDRAPARTPRAARCRSGLPRLAARAPLSRPAIGTLVAAGAP